MQRSKAKLPSKIEVMGYERSLEYGSRKLFRSDDCENYEDEEE